MGSFDTDVGLVCWNEGDCVKARVERRCGWWIGWVGFSVGCVIKTVVIGRGKRIWLSGGFVLKEVNEQRQM